MEAEGMELEGHGNLVERGKGLWDNGKLTKSVNFPIAGIYRFDVVARGKLAGTYPPNMAIAIDGRTVANWPVSSHEWQWYSSESSQPISAGYHELGIAFTNDYYLGPEGDRNLFVDKISFSPAGPQCFQQTDLDHSLTTKPLRSLAEKRGLLIGAACRTSFLRKNTTYRKTLAREFNLTVDTGHFKPDIIAARPNEYDFLITM